MDSLLRVIKRRRVEWLFFILFFAITILGIIGQFFWPSLERAIYSPALNASLSIGTGGMVAFIFYYAVNERIERRRRETVRHGALRTYRDAKRNIAVALIHSSQRGGRRDLSADHDTIEKIMTISGFEELFKDGREANEGFYAFKNQMHERTFEYDEIIFNLKSIGRACERIIDSVHVDDKESYNRLLRLDSFLRRIESCGPGYDESKILCGFIWDMFAGFSFIQGSLGYDPIERALENS